MPHLLHLSARLLRACTLALLAVAGTARGQQYGFIQLTPRDGLAQSQVRCMAQDKTGYLWIGTLGGASRFDGLDFTNFGLRDGLPDPQVNALLGASDGRVWLGCGSSLVCFDGRSMATVMLPGINAESRVLALAEGKDGTIYAGTDGNGLYEVVKGHARAAPGWPADSACHVRALLAMPDGTLLVGMREGLFQGQGNNWQQRRLPMPVSISSLAMDRSGNLWLGTYGDGLIQLRPDGSTRPYSEMEGLLQNNVRAVLADRQERVWTATKFGMDLLDNGKLRAYTVHQGMPNDNIWCLYEDDQGNLWVGTDGAGVLRYAGESFVTFTVTDGLCSDQVMAGVRDRAGDIWLATYGNGICRLDGMAQVTTLEGLPNNTVWCGAADGQDGLWFGTSDGLCHLVNGAVQPLPLDGALAGQRVLSLLPGPGGALWCGTREGVYLRTPQGTIAPLELDGPMPRGVRAIQPATDGQLWLATDNGVARVKNGKIRYFTTADGLSHNTVFCLAFDRAGRIWAGTSNGLTCIAGDRVQRLDLGTDFGSNYVDMLLPAPDGQLWAGTNNGMYIFHPDSLLHDPTDKRHITEGDGIRGMEFNLNAGFLDDHGRMFFGTNAGLVMHDPARDHAVPARAAPKAHITGISSYLETLRGPDSLDMPNASPLRVGYRENHLTFTYTAIALSQGKQVRFQYRLAGFDKDWLPATRARFASYSNLPQGEYVFEVRAAVGGDINAAAWGTPAAVPFIITPPFWLTTWFFALCGLLLAALLWAIMRFRAARRSREDKTRNLILRSRMLQLEQQALNANMNRHFIFNALNSIQYSINSQDRAGANKYLTSFAKLIRKNLDASQGDTTSLAEELERLELYLVLEQRRFKERFNYSINVGDDVDPTQVELPAMMLQPYVENSIWHGILPMARPGRVNITVERAGADRVRIQILDNGMGVDRSRAEKLGKETDHISRGIEIAKGRSDVLRKLGLADIRIQGPEQMQHGEGGTQVLIELPAAPFVGKPLPHQN